MYSEINVAEKTATIRVYSGYGPGPHIKLTGSTFPIVPAGTIVDKLSVKVPDGLQGIAFFCRVEEPQRRGSGKTAYLDYTPQLSTSVLLIWEEDDGKLIVKADKDMSASELARFNSFIRSDVDVFVVDSERKIAYSSFLPNKAVDPTWTYKSVSVEAILYYITKKLTMEQLDERVTSEQRARDKVQELRETNRFLDNENRRVMGRAEELFDQVRELQAKEEAHSRIIATLMTSKGLYKLLKRLPVKFRPKAFDGFVGAMDSFDV